MPMFKGETARVFIADEHPIFLVGLRALLDEHDDIDVVGQATSCVQSLRLAMQTEPDIVVIDGSLKTMSVIEQLGAEMPAVPVICLSANEDSTHVRHALGLGARGYVLKRSSEQYLCMAIHAVRRGGLYIDPTIASRFVSITDLAPKRAHSARGKQPLTDREREVLRLIALGFTNKEVAGKLGVTAKSVETYKTRASVKLDIHSRAKIVQYAILQGWFHNSPQ